MSDYKGPLTLTRAHGVQGSGGHAKQSIMQSLEKHVFRVDTDGEGREKQKEKKKSKRNRGLDRGCMYIVTPLVHGGWGLFPTESGMLCMHLTVQHSALHDIASRSMGMTIGSRVYGIRDRVE